MQAFAVVEWPNGIEVVRPCFGLRVIARAMLALILRLLKKLNSDLTSRYMSSQYMDSTTPVESGAQKRQLHQTTLHK
jgi:hypothetical protein